MHDPRIGRFFAVDPLAPKYPHNSPYAFSENRVTNSIEIEGLEAHDNNLPKAKAPTPRPAPRGDGSYTYTPTFVIGDPIMQMYQQDPDVAHQSAQSIVGGAIDGISYAFTSVAFHLHFAEYNSYIGGEYYTPSQFSAMGIPTAVGFSFNEGFIGDKAYEFTDQYSNQMRFYGGVMGIIGGASALSNGFNFARLGTKAFTVSNQETTKFVIQFSYKLAAAERKYAFGLKNIVVDFAEEIGASHLMKDQNWRSTFGKIVSSPNNEIHFILNGIDETPMQMILNPNRSGINWEMNTLYNSQAFDKTIFYYNNNTYIGFDLFQIKL